MQEKDDSDRTVECEQEESNAWTHAVTTFCLLYPHNNAEVNAVDGFLGVTSLIPGVPVCRATRYGLDGKGIEFRWGRNFQHPARPTLGPTQPPKQSVPGFFNEYKGRGVALNTLTL
jgi:hypothetical protein